MPRDHGPTIEDDERYEVLRDRGMSKKQLISALRRGA